MECATPRVSPNLSYDVERQWCVNIGTSIAANIPLWWDVDNVKGYMCVRAGGGEEIVATFCQLLCEPKISLKYRIYE